MYLEFRINENNFKDVYISDVTALPLSYKHVLKPFDLMNEISKNQCYFESSYKKIVTEFDSICKEQS